jgi:hypothetical protein
LRDPLGEVTIDVMATDRSSPHAKAEPPSFAIRAAVWIGDAFGRWQRRRAAARDDSFVETWKAAWNEGCEAFKAGRPQTSVPYSRSPRKDAWMAGWLWAARQPRS